MLKETASAQSLIGVHAAVVLLLRALDKTRARMAADLDLSGSELRVLFRIAEPGRITPKMLATSTDLSMGAVTAIAARLVARDMVCRVANPEDRRSLFLELTASGAGTMNGLYDQFRALIGAGHASLSPAEEAILETQLLNVAAALGHRLEPGLAGTHTANKCAPPHRLIPPGAR